MVSIVVVLKRWEIEYFTSKILFTEPNSYLHRTGISFSAKSLAEGFQSLRYTLNQYPYWKNSKIIGPDISGFFRKKSKDMMKKLVLYKCVFIVRNNEYCFGNNCSALISDSWNMLVWLWMRLPFTSMYYSLFLTHSSIKWSNAITMRF